MDNVYQNDKPVAAATGTVFFRALRTIFLLFITIPLLQLTRAQAPHITSFHPTSAGQWDTVAISGTHLDSVKTVSFGGVRAYSVTILSDSLVWAIVGTGASGKVKVFTAQSSDSLSGFTYILQSPPPIPHITSFIPDSARLNDTVFIRGIRFTGVTAVSFGGVPAQSFHILSDSTIWAVVGTGASGRVKVTHSPFSDSLGGFIFISAPPVTKPPTISSFAPQSGSTGTVVTIAGTHFTGTTQVLFGGTAARFTVQSDTMITAVIGTGSTGAVKVFTHGGLAIATALFSFIPAPPPTVPHILSFTPDSARQGDTVTIYGQHFDSVITVSFGGVPAHSFTILSDSLIWAIVGTGASGKVKVAKASASDSLGGFIFIAPHPPVAPHLISFTPQSAGQWDTVSLRGTHLSSVTSVTFGGVRAYSFTILSDSLIWAIVGTGASGKVKVFTAQSSDSLSGFIFVLKSSPVPHILSFSPDSARQGDTVSIRGFHFTGATAVSFGKVTAKSFTVLSDSLIWAIVGSGASGYVKVTGFSYSDSLGGFIFISAPPVTQPPTISSFAPQSGSTGTVVTIAGTHFTGTTQVLFGGTAAGFTVQSDTMITAVIGTGSTGAVKVFTHGGLAVATALFTFIPPPPATPHILSFTPDSARQGDTVTLYGSHLDSVTAVSFGNVPARSFTIFSDSLIQAIVGTGASGSVRVSTTSASDSLGGFIFISSDTTTPPPPPPASFKLISFTGASVSSHVSLTWSVQFDQAIFFYSVEHSTDTVSSHFVSIGGVAAQKLDSANYAFTDTATRTGVNYYRLRIVDTVGNTTFSGTFAIDLGNVPGTISLYPNPAIGRVVVTVPATWLSSKFVLADAAGQIVLTVPVRAGVQQVIIPVGRFNKGVYKLIWTNGQISATRTILILK